LLWLAAAFVATMATAIGTTEFPEDPIVKWSLLAVSVGTLLEVLKVTLDLRRLPPRHTPRDQDAADV
jgi:peptidoglycan/LPS O-acetylase OafA/YrhL